MDKGEGNFEWSTILSGTEFRLGDKEGYNQQHLCCPLTEFRREMHFRFHINCSHTTCRNAKSPCPPLTLKSTMRT
uniref:Uncharacterized protein n=1 Tax=Sphaerodactylus townsendi TaxID=933632 RepID=A0ACB8GEL0_9SAUR